MRQSATERAAAPSLPRAPGVGAGVGASVVGAGDVVGAGVGAGVVGAGVGAGVVGAGVVGAGVGAGVGAQVPWMTPHDVASHGALKNAE